MSQSRPSPVLSPPGPVFDDPLGRLHLSFDGRPPLQARRVALVGGEAEWEMGWRDGQARLTAFLCREAVEAVAARRVTLSGRTVRRDRWLLRLTMAMAQARHQAVSSLVRHLP